MSFQKSHLNLTLADVLKIVRGWLREYELHNAHIRIGQAFGPLVREQVLFTIDVVEVAIPADGSTTSESPSEVVMPMADLSNDELTPFDQREVTDVSDSEITEPEELSF